MTKFSRISYSIFSLAYIYKIAAELIIRSNILSTNIVTTTDTRIDTISGNTNLYTEFIEILKLHQHLLACLSSKAEELYKPSCEQEKIEEYSSKITLSYPDFFKCQISLDQLYQLTRRRDEASLKDDLDWNRLYSIITTSIFPEAQVAFFTAKPHEYMSADRVMSFKKSQQTGVNVKSTNFDIDIISCFINDSLTTAGVAEAFVNFFKIRA